MVNVHLKNEKLIERGIGMLQEATSVDRKTAEQALKAAGNLVPVAMIMLRHSSAAPLPRSDCKHAKRNSAKRSAAKLVPPIPRRKLSCNNVVTRTRLERQ